MISVGVSDAELHHEFRSGWLLSWCGVAERDLGFARAVDDVVVGHDQPIRIDDHARTEGTRNPLARPAEAATIAEEALEEIVSAALIVVVIIVNCCFYYYFQSS